MALILASQSPRREQLLLTLGLDFTITGSAEVDEARILRETTGDLKDRLKHLALLKGQDAAAAHPDDIVLSADTVVVINDEVLGKPRDVEDARQMLSRLSGRAHHVYTGVAVQRPATGYRETGVESTRVTFNLVDSATIDRYIARAQPFDKAGSYAIQGLGSLLVRKIEGDYSNVVGLPLPLTARLLTGAGMVVL